MGAIAGKGAGQRFAFSRNSPEARHGGSGTRRPDSGHPERHEPGNGAEGISFLPCLKAFFKLLAERIGRNILLLLPSLAESFPTFTGADRKDPHFPFRPDRFFGTRPAPDLRKEEAVQPANFNGHRKGSWQKDPSFCRLPSLKSTVFPSCDGGFPRPGTPRKRP